MENIADFTSAGAIAGPDLESGECPSRRLRVDFDPAYSSSSMGRAFWPVICSGKTA